MKNLIKEMQCLLTELEADNTKLFDKNNFTAGVRIRSKMQELKKKADALRNAVQVHKKSNNVKKPKK